MIRLSKAFPMKPTFAERRYQRRSVGRPCRVSTSRAAIDRQGPPPDPGPDPGGGRTHTIEPPNGPLPSTGFLLSKPHASRTTTHQKGFPMNHRSSLRRQSFVATALCTALLACNATRSLAAPYTWTGAGANGSWATAANWAPTGITTGTTPHTVTYNNNVNTTNTVSGTYTLSSLDFTNTAGAFTINGDTSTRALTIRGNITNSSTNTQTINTRLAYPSAANVGSFDIGGVGDITIGGALTSGTGVTVNVVGPGTVTLTAASSSFSGVLANGTSGVLDTSTSGLTAIAGSFVNDGNLLVNGNFEIGGSMDLNSTSTVAFSVPADPSQVNTITYGDGSSYGGNLNVNLLGTYANTGTSPTLVNSTSFLLFNPTDSVASGGFTTVTGLYAGTPLTFSEVGAGSGYWASNAIVGGPQDGQYLVFEENTGMLMVVPEPSAVVIAGVGVALAGWRMARRRKGGKPSA